EQEEQAVRRQPPGHDSRDLGEIDLAEEVELQVAPDGPLEPVADIGYAAESRASTFRRAGQPEAPAREPFGVRDAGLRQAGLEADLAEVVQACPPGNGRRRQRLQPERKLRLPRGLRLGPERAAHLADGLDPGAQQRPEEPPPVARVAHITKLAVAEQRAHPALARSLEQEVSDGDVGRREAAVPEDDRLVVALAARLAADDDLRQLRVERRLGQPAGVDVRAQGAEAAAPALAPV